MNGIVKSFSDFRGYGFITGDDGKDYFAHVSKINGTGYLSLDTGDRVIFEPHKNYKGDFAVDIRMIGNNIAAKTDSFTLKRNPFTPQKPISDSHKFAGREDDICNAVDSLYNGKNILITGARGIGKSSLAYQLLYMTSGETELLQKIGIEEDNVFNNIICDHRCMRGNNLMDIASGLISTLYNRLEIDPASYSQTIGVDLKFINYSQTETPDPIAISDIASAFATQVENIFRTYTKDQIGITFLIDEIDTLDSSIDIASFLKSICEKFDLDSYDNFYIIVSGVTGTITNLIAQHPSANRLFETINLEKMSYPELQELVNLHLTNTGISISNDALTQIIKLSNDFPQPVQLIGYHAFRVDNNGCIDIDDVQKAVNYVVQKLKKQEYDIRFDSLGKGKNIIVLRRMVLAPYPTVSINYIVQSGEITDSEASGVLRNLTGQGIVERPFRNQYRICEPLFGIYLRILFDIM